MKDVFCRDCNEWIEDPVNHFCQSEERAPVRSDTVVSRPTLRPDSAQDAPLAERRGEPKQFDWREWRDWSDDPCAAIPMLNNLLSEHGIELQKNWPSGCDYIELRAVALPAVANETKPLEIELTEEELEALNGLNDQKPSERSANGRDEPSGEA